MKSKGYLRFKNRIDRFSVDKEMLSILNSNKSLLADSSALFKGVNSKNHPILHRYENNDHNRMLVVTHLQATFNVSYIKDIYEEVTAYFQYTLFHGAKAMPNKDRLVGEHKCTFTANEVLSANSHDAVVKMVMDNIFQQLERDKSTITVITKIRDKLDLSVDQIVIDEALPYLEMRHVFVHTDGKPNAKFRYAYPNIAIGSNGKIKLDKMLLKKAKGIIEKLILDFDREMIKKSYFPTEEMQP